jgi:hypothetical protein
MDAGGNLPTGCLSGRRKSVSGALETGPALIFAEAAPRLPGSAYSDPPACQRPGGVSATPCGERIYRVQIWVVREKGTCPPAPWKRDVVSEQQRKRGRIERAQAMAAMGWQPQDQARRRDIIPDDVKQMVWMGMEGSACDVALRPSFSSTTSSCSRWVAAARLRTYKFSAARAIAGRAPA